MPRGVTNAMFFVTGSKKGMIDLNEVSVMKIIHQHRKKLKYTQEMMAKELGISRSAYALIENNQHHLRFDMFIQILNVLKIPFFAFKIGNVYYLPFTEEEIRWMNEKIKRFFSLTSMMINENFFLSESWW